MCGAIGRVIDNPFVKALMDLLNIKFQTETDYNIRPNARIPIAIGKQGKPVGVEASWWLFQTMTENGFSYDKRYRSFNTRKEKLFTNRKYEFAHQRCVIPASFFYEWNGKRFKIEPTDSAIAFGGIYRMWPVKNESKHYSCSIITLPAHRKFIHIHDNSFPLMLLPEEITPWLDDGFHDINYWQDTLKTKIRFDLKVTPVDKKNPIFAVGKSQIIYAD
ncbi:SOS response-associated peptidase family protein [Aliikangiella sp. G2MR2-5]|uniref:SOS response-associated peptidase family protein n=1 Tax=Aliikangiella sp. G2MR2-5 TaxID=2788943 RepID=UPI0018AAD4D0|nr:SOS response-associated peptidase family protein [Aliikangiella sp. G2MR2-5]